MLVNLSGPLRAAADGAATVELEASSIRELFNVMRERYPAFAAAIENGVAVAINGEIYRDQWSTPIPPSAEVFLLPRIQGG